jgi:PA14 domain
MRRRMIGGALVMAAGALGCVAEVRTGNGAYTPPPPGPSPAVYNNAPQAAAPTPAPAPAAVAATVAPAPAPAPAPSLTNPAAPHIPGGATIASNGTSTSGVHYPTSMFGNRTTAALKGMLYYVPDTTQQFPDVSKLTPQGTIWVNQLAVPMHDFEQGFPGVTNRTEWFAIRYTGVFNASRPGVYSFALVADDGANLYIDGTQVINNDGRHLPQEKDGQINLTAGSHSIQVDYFKGLRWVVALQLYCTPPGGQRVYWSQTM